MRTAFLLAVCSLLARAGDGVTVSEFARRHGLVESRDALAGQDILKGSATVVLAPGMSVALVDGVAVRLSEPARVEGGRTVLSAGDAETLARWVRAAAPQPAAEPAPRVEPVPVRPAATPAKKPALTPAARTPNRAPGRFRTVVLDPGHGGVHTGGKGARGTLEKDIVLEVSLAIRDRLVDNGIRVVMTREKDKHLAPEVRDDLRRRAEFTNRVGPDLFLSIHVNWAENKGAEGFEVFYPRAGCEGSATERQVGRRVAESVRKTFAERFDTPDRGVKEAGFFVIKNAECPAVLVELEFVSNVTGEKKLREGSYRKRLADAVADAVLAEHRR